MESESEEELSDHNEDAVTYTNATFLAFVDPSSTDKKAYKLGYVTRDVSDTNKEIICNVFESDGPLQFKLIAKDQTIPDEAIICEAKVETTKTSGPKKSPIPAAVKTTKQIHNKIAKLMPAIAEAMDN